MLGTPRHTGPAWRLFVVALLLAACSPAAPGTTPSGEPSITIADVRALALSGSEHPVIVEAAITNNGAESDTLVGGTSPAGERVELDATSGCAPPDDGTGMTGMEPMVRWLIEAGQTITLQGGGGHLTLVGLDRSPALGAELDVTFIFERGGAITVRVPVTSTADDDAPASPEPATGCAS